MATWNHPWSCIFYSRYNLGHLDYCSCTPLMIYNLGQVLGLHDYYRVQALLILDLLYLNSIKFSLILCQFRTVFRILEGRLSLAYFLLVKIIGSSIDELVIRFCSIYLNKKSERSLWHWLKFDFHELDFI